MTVGVSRTRDLVEKLAAASAEMRDLAADSVTDWVRSFEHREAAIVSRVLVWLATVETDDTAREAQLHALAELAEYGLLPADVLADTGQLSHAELRGSSIEHLDYLQSLHRGQ